MSVVRFAISLRKRMEQYLPGMDRPGSLVLRSYQTKRNDCMIF